MRATMSESKSAFRTWRACICLGYTSLPVNWLHRQRNVAVEDVQFLCKNGHRILDNLVLLTLHWEKGAMSQEVINGTHISI
jgi:hypothetical protein